MTHTITERLLNAGASGNRDIEAENLANAAPDMLSALEAIKEGMEQTGGMVPFFLADAVDRATGKIL